MEKHFPSFQARLSSYVRAWMFYFNAFSIFHFKTLYCISLNALSENLKERLGWKNDHSWVKAILTAATSFWPRHVLFPGRRPHECSPEDSWSQLFLQHPCFTRNSACTRKFISVNFVFLSVPDITFVRLGNVDNDILICLIQHPCLQRAEWREVSHLSTKQAGPSLLSGIRHVQSDMAIDEMINILHS